MFMNMPVSYKLGKEWGMTMVQWYVYDIITGTDVQNVIIIASYTFQPPYVK